MNNIQYGILLKEEVRIVANPDNKTSDKDIILKKDTLLYTQKSEFTFSQIKTLIEKGFHYQFGFGPMYDYIPYSKLQMVKIEALVL